MFDSNIPEGRAEDESLRLSLNSHKFKRFKGFPGQARDAPGTSQERAFGRRIQLNLRSKNMSRGKGGASGKEIKAPGLALSLVGLAAAGQASAGCASPNSALTGFKP